MTREVVGILDSSCGIKALPEDLQGGVVLTDKSQTQFVLFAEKYLDWHSEHCADPPLIDEPFSYTTGEDFVSSVLQLIRKSQYIRINPGGRILSK